MKSSWRGMQRGIRLLEDTALLDPIKPFCGMPLDEGVLCMVPEG